MSRSLSVSRSLWLITFLSLSSLLAHAQFRASLRGTVTDQQGAAVSGATVTLTNTATNQKLVSTSDANGIYQFNALGPAPYSLTAEHAGFKKRALDNVQIKSANGDNRGWKKDNHEGVVDDDIYFAVITDNKFKPVQDDPLSKSLPPIDQE